MKYIAFEADGDAHSYETSDGSRAVLHTGCIFEISILCVKLRPMRLCSLPNDGIRHGEFVAHRCDGSQAQALNIKMHYLASAHCCNGTVRIGLAALH